MIVTGGVRTQVFTNPSNQADAEQILHGQIMHAQHSQQYVLSDRHGQSDEPRAAAGHLPSCKSRLQHIHIICSASAALCSQRISGSALCSDCVYVYMYVCPTEDTYIHRFSTYVPGEQRPGACKAGQ